MRIFTYQEELKKTNKKKQEMLTAYQHTFESGQC